MKDTGGKSGIDGIWEERMLRLLHRLLPLVFVFAFVLVFVIVFVFVFVFECLVTCVSGQLSFNHWLLQPWRHTCTLSRSALLLASVLLVSIFLLVFIEYFLVFINISFIYNVCFLQYSHYSWVFICIFSYVYLYVFFSAIFFGTCRKKLIFWENSNLVKQKLSKVLIGHPTWGLISKNLRTNCVCICRFLVPCGPK